MINIDLPEYTPQELRSGKFLPVVGRVELCGRSMGRIKHHARYLVGRSSRGGVLVSAQAVQRRDELYATANPRRPLRFRIRVKNGSMWEMPPGLDCTLLDFVDETLEVPEIGDVESGKDYPLDQIVEIGRSYGIHDLGYPVGIGVGKKNEDSVFLALRGYGDPEEMVAIKNNIHKYMATTPRAIRVLERVGKLKL